MPFRAARRPVRGPVSATSAVGAGEGSRPPTQVWGVQCGRETACGGDCGGWVIRGTPPAMKRTLYRENAQHNCETRVGSEGRAHIAEVQWSSLRAWPAQVGPRMGQPVENSRHSDEWPCSPLLGIAGRRPMGRPLVFTLSDGGGVRRPVSPAPVASSAPGSVHRPRRSRAHSGGSNTGCWTRGRGFSGDRTANTGDGP